MLQNFISTFFQILDSILGFIFQFLPDSPLEPFISQLSELPFLGYINWFIPVGTFLAILTAWGAAIGIFYAYQAVLRWIKATD